MFSGALKLTDLNDFITPSQECVKPVQLSKREGKGKSVIVNDEGDYFQTDEGGSSKKLEKAKITLNDCLACSGCITSAESILITQQSQEELYRVIQENKLQQSLNQSDKIKTIVVSISPQSSASIAAKCNLDIETTARKLTSYFRKLGVSYVFDTTVARDFSLLECQREFINRYKNKDVDPKALPMLSSACPGWICYAEKTHGEWILPYLSTVKSPQQIMGALVKDFLAKRIGVSPAQMYHVTVMPCFDKKLEASRGGLDDLRDTDCVITSVEVEAMLEAEGVSLADVEPQPMDRLSPSLPDHLYRHAGSTSGGYCEQVFTHAARELCGMEVDQVEYKTLSNPDIREVACGEDLRFGVANGFRNIQNVVRRLKSGRTPFHFVEVMACPSGCANGGAQIRPVDQSAKALLEHVERLYFSLPIRAPGEGATGMLYNEWLDEKRAKTMLHTSYHAVEKANNALFIKW